MADGLAAGPAHLPSPAQIVAYGNGGFRFGGMSHRGSLLCLPDGIWGWPIKAVTEVTEAAFAQVFALSDKLDVFLIGTGRDPWPLPEFPTRPRRGRERARSADRNFQQWLNS